MSRVHQLPVAVGLLVASVALVSAQRATRDPRLAFEGVWNSATATPLERPAALKDTAVFTPEAAAAFERETAARNEEPPPGAPRTGTGTYNTFYREFGTRVVKTRRTSIVVDPPDGRIPPLIPAVEARRQARLDAMRAQAHPETLGLQDQCITFLTAGPPLLPYTYNSNYQIVVTKDAVVVHAEMIHEARVIHMNRGTHLPAAIRQWTGDSIGRWEGETLVVDTTNFMDGGGYYGEAGGNFAFDANLRVVERFRLLDPDTLLYRFEIDDATAYSRPWAGELTMTRTSDRIYEFACHEANYSLDNMLRGARATERKQP